MSIFHISSSPGFDLFDMMDDLFDPLHYVGRYLTPISRNVHRSRPHQDVARWTLDVRAYKPEELSVKLEEGKLVVSGRSRREAGGGFDSSEFLRRYDLPEDADTATLRQRITQDGLLVIEMNRKTVEPARLGGSKCCTDPSRFHVSIDVRDFKPEEVSVKLDEQSDQITVHAKQRVEEKDDDHGVHVQHREFHRVYRLPEDTVKNAITTRLTKEGNLVIEAPRQAQLQRDQSCRTLIVSKEADGEASKE